MFLVEIICRKVVGSMGKIGLITFCNHEVKVNYGQVLQAYGLYKYLTSKGYDVKVINYRPPYRDEGGLGFNLFRKTFFYSEKYKKSNQGKLYTVRNKKFYRFMKDEMNLSKPCYTEEDVIKELQGYDVFLAGSDQVWNIDSYDEIRLLGVKIDIRKISYASSGVFVETKEAEIIYKKMKPYWDDMEYISVREGSAKRIIEKYTEKKVEVVADPTLLLDKEQWSIGKNKVKQPYILCYFLGGARSHLHILEHIKKKLGIEKIIFIDADIIEKHKGYGEVRRDVGPNEFVSLVKNASFVCTDSYHGSAFSLIFEKQFCLFKRFHKYNDTYASEERWRIMFEDWNLKERMVRNIKEYDKIADINYEVLSRKIKMFVEKSKKYLDNILGG